MYVLAISLQTVPLQSIMHKLDECLKELSGGVYNTLPSVGHYTRENEQHYDVGCIFTSSQLKIIQSPLYSTMNTYQQLGRHSSKPTILSHSSTGCSRAGHSQSPAGGNGPSLRAKGTCTRDLCKFNHTHHNMILTASIIIWF